MRAAIESGALPPGFRVGHWTHPDRPTGTTVIVPDGRAVAACDVRGGAPATRETDLLESWRPVERVDAVVFSGGSAYGLASADGVMLALARSGRGLVTQGGLVPIVPAACLYDCLRAGTDAQGIPVHPGAQAGELALAAASENPGWGVVGAGAGASVAKLSGHEGGRPSGVGAAMTLVGDSSLGAVAVVNALGSIVDDDGSMLAGDAADFGSGTFVSRTIPVRGNTTLVAVLTDASLSPGHCQVLAVTAHDGLGRAIRPAHTAYDGDSVFVLANGQDGTPRDAAVADALSVCTADVVAAAIRHGVTSAAAARREE